MTKLRNLVGAAVAAMLAGCASILGGTEQTIPVSTGEVAGASCKVTDARGGFWYLPDTPSEVTVPKGRAPLTVVCEKEGYETGSVALDARVTPRTIVSNVPLGVLFGLIGGGAGVAVDAASGAIAEYPDAAFVSLTPTSTQVAASGDETPGKPAPPTIQSRVEGLVRLSPMPVAVAVAPIRTIPDATGEVVKLVRVGDQIELLEATPDGWLRAAEQGKPVGWIHWTAFPIPRETIRVQALAASN